MDTFVKKYKATASLSASICSFKCKHVESLFFLSLFLVI